MINEPLILQNAKIQSAKDARVEVNRRLNRPNLT